MCVLHVYCVDTCIRCLCLRACVCVCGTGKGASVTGWACMAVSVLLWVPGSQTCSAATSPGPRPHWLWGSCLSAVCADPQAGMSLSPPFPWALCWAHRFLGPSVEASRCCFKGHFFCKLFPPAFPESAPQASAAEIRAFVCNLTLLAGLRAVLRSWRGGRPPAGSCFPEGVSDGEMCPQAHPPVRGGQTTGQ